MYDLALVGQPQFTSFCVFFAATVCGFIVEAWPRNVLLSPSEVSQHSDKTQPLDNDWNRPTTYDQSNLFSRLCFHFLQPIISSGYYRPLRDEDIANMMPRGIRTIHSYDSISRLSKQAPSLLWVVFKACGWPWLPIIVFAFTESVMEFLQPILLNVILGFILSLSTEQPQPIALGIIMAVGMFAAALLTSLASGQFFQLGTNLGIELKTGLIAMIYRKTLKLSPAARREATLGEIMNRMSVDAERVGNAVKFLPQLLTTPFEIAIGIWLLYQQLGLSAFVGLGVVLIMIPVQGKIAKVLHKAKGKKLEAMDMRIRLLTDILSGIRAVKLYSWERSFQEQLRGYRKKELKHIGHIGATIAVMMIMYTSMPSLMSLLSFVVYALVGGPNVTRGTISAQVVFVSITLFGRLSKPIGRVSHVINQSISLKVAVKRIQSYLLQEELDESQVDYQPAPLRTPTQDISTGEIDRGSADKHTLSVQVLDGVFSWNSPDPNLEAAATVASEHSPTKDQRLALNNINLQVSPGNLTAIMGRVGQGKSSLLSAIIGDMYKCQGAVKVYGLMAYVPQQAWIINATVRDNITFGKPFDQERYDHVLFASGLLPDLEILAAGDLTEIGERGINLSGGQKQRVSLARAAYQD
ncbi:hypothetical protein BGZ65_000094, partial [Modicella reniformis]